MGDQTLQYLGKSYGTMLGATYAELFPDKVGRMVLDGVLPVGLDLVEVTKGQADSFEWMVHDFARYCLGTDLCPLNGSEDQAVKQLQDWLLAFSNGLRIPAALQFNTGMNRLGIDPHEIEECLAILRSCSSVKVRGLLSHFAAGEKPSSALTRPEFHKPLMRGTLPVTTSRDISAVSTCRKLDANATMVAQKTDTDGEKPIAMKKMMATSDRK